MNISSVIHYRAAIFRPSLAGCLICAGMLSAVLLAGCGRSASSPSPRVRLERRFAAEGKRFLLLPYAVPDEHGARTIRIRRGLLADAQFYCRAPDHEGYLLIDAAGGIDVSGAVVAAVQEYAELVFTADEATLYVDGVPVELGLKDWQKGWVTAGDQPPEVENMAHPLVDYADAFTRAVLEDDVCQPEKGVWSLRQRGGGMAPSSALAETHSFQRAVNPFSARGSGNGRLIYGDSSWLDCAGGASFYLGKPREGEIIDRDWLPVDTDMLVSWGPAAGASVQFGWIGRMRAFVVRERASENAEWRILSVHRAKRPPVTNWFRLELASKGGYRVVARLDGVDLCEISLPRKVTGPFAVCCGEGEIEFDDVAIRSARVAVEVAEPLFRQSQQFVSKTLLDEGHDPLQFLEWARGERTFLQWQESGDDADSGRLIAMTRLPLLGGFFYRSGELAALTVAPQPYFGNYRFHFMPASAGGNDTLPSGEGILASFAMALDDGGWQALDLAADVWPAGHREAALEFRRDESDAGGLAFKVNGVWRRSALAAPGAVRAVVEFSGPLRAPPPPSPTPDKPRWGRGRTTRREAGQLREQKGEIQYEIYRPVNPDFHQFRLVNLHSELFEKSPVDWSWLEGAFRMDCRWACQDNWNFMACGAPGVPMMTSKRWFGGQQTHEYFLSLRPVFPWEIGDKEFVYDASSDGEWAIFSRNRGWYNRHDFNFSFCFDGRNPLSGYAVLFGAGDNRVTCLLREGKVVASTSDPEFLFPTAYGTGAVHWRWWKFSAEQSAGRVVVRLNDRLMFDYQDAAPLSGGHVAMWSRRNGFAVAKVSSLAEQVAWRPDVLYVANDSPDAPWSALPRDSSTLDFDAGSGTTRVTNNRGGGEFAIRHRLPGTVDLSGNPVLRLPLELGENVAVNLHLGIGGKAYLVKISAPVQGGRTLLAGEFEKGEVFQLPLLDPVASGRLLGEASPALGLLVVDLGAMLEKLAVPKERWQLESLTLGNTSNQNYLLFGGGGMNPAGAVIRLGKPGFYARDAAP